MKVLHILPSLQERFGGPSLAMRAIAEALADRGVEVDVICADDPPQGLCQWQIQGEGKWRLLCLGGRGYRRRWSWPLALWLWRNAHRYGVIHIHSLFGFVPAVAMVVAGLRHVPYGLRPLGTLAAYGLRHGPAWMKALSLRFVEGPLLHRAAFIHCTSLAEQQEVQALGFAHVCCIPLALPAPDSGALPLTIEAHWPQLGGRRYLLFLSRLDAKKGLPDLLSVWAELAARHPGVILVVAGGGEQSEVAGLRKLAQELGLRDEVFWAGPVRGEAKRVLLANAAAFVLPSRHENFGLALLEAMQWGLPCVSTDQVALAVEPACRDAVLQVRCGDRHALWEVLHELLSDPELARQRGRLAREAAAHFCPSTMAAELHRLYLLVAARS
jgi:glycosyltransferase involved in cell wall biosynthesis